MHRHGNNQETLLVYDASANSLLEQVLIWTGLAGGDSEYCAILVAVNSVLQMEGSCYVD